MSRKLCASAEQVWRKFRNYQDARDKLMSCMSQYFVAKANEIELRNSVTFSRHRLAT